MTGKIIISRHIIFNDNVKQNESYLDKNWDKIIWYQLSQNPEAIDILNKNRDKIVWSELSENPNAGELFKDRVEYENKLPKKKYNELSNHNKLNWYGLSKNPSIFTFN
jgi:hypothetical protein